MRPNAAKQDVDGSLADARERMTPDRAADEAITDRWRRATPAERGQVLWGLLEFADNVGRGRTAVPVVEPLGELPAPLAPRQIG